MKDFDTPGEQAVCRQGYGHEARERTRHEEM